MTVGETLAAESAGEAPGAESSILKIKATELQQAITELALQVAGHHGPPNL
ncbi:MAG: acyl-CoA dehydrogenase family protein, partial [Pseudomonadota bacterium]